MPCISANLKHTEDIFSTYVGVACSCIVVVVAGIVLKAYKRLEARQDFKDALKLGDLMMNVCTPLMALAPQDSWIVQGNMAYLGVWALAAYLVILWSDLTEANAAIYYKNSSPAGRRVVFMNLKRVVRGLVILMNCGFTGLNIIYLSLKKKLPFRVRTILKAFIVLTSGLKLMMTEVTEPKKFARRLADNSLIEMAEVKDLPSTVYDKIFEDKQNSVNFLTVNIDMTQEEEPSVSGGDEPRTRLVAMVPGDETEMSSVYDQIARLVAMEPGDETEMSSVSDLIARYENASGRREAP